MANLAEQKFQRFFMAALLKYPNIEAFGRRYTFAFKDDPIRLSTLEPLGALESGVFMKADRIVNGERSVTALRVGSLEEAAGFVTAMAPAENRDRVLEEERMAIMGGLAIWEAARRRPGPSSMELD